MRLILLAVLLMSVGCVMQSSRAPTANAGDEILPVHKQAQLLAAARQYEKESRPDLAMRYYRQVLAIDPDNVEAANGLDYVQSGHLRTQAGYQEIVASAHPRSRPRLRSPAELAGENAVIDEKTAQIIANAAASATAQAIANAVAKATARYMDEAPVTAKSLKDAKPQPTPAEVVEVASSEPTDSPPAVSVTKSEEKTPKSAPSSDQKADLKVVSSKAVTRDDGITRVEEVSHQIKADSDAGTDTAGKPGTGEPALIVNTDVPDDARPLPESLPDASSDDSWGKPQSLTRLCFDANAAVLREVAKLDSVDPRIRNEGLRALARMGPDASSATLPVRMLIHGEDELVRAHAAWAAWELTGDAVTAVEPLTGLLNSDDSQVVAFAAYTLAGIGEEARPALPILRRLLESDEQRVRLHAAETMARIGTPSDRAAATDTLVMMTAERSPAVRTLALLALGSIETDPTLDMTTALTSALHDSDAEVRSAAALALGAFGPAARSVIAQLEFVVESDRPDVKQAAATALECIREKDRGNGSQ